MITLTFKVVKVEINLWAFAVVLQMLLDRFVT